uniref:Uncharacterized protein n=1 Tax=Nilaparvata lugens TaxID=108931 RepID=A0A220XIR5_NILLU|nr:hypothetical protein [Nilaparvata lugens]
MNVILLLSLMNIILLIQAETSEVYLFNLLDGGRTGYVSVSDVVRVNNVKEKIIGKGSAVEALKDAISKYENGRVCRSEFDGIVQGISGIKATVDLTKYLGRGKRILDYHQVKELLGITNDELDRRIFHGDNMTGNGPYVEPKVLARILNE